jgi:acyl-CoA reductase-like NAD-dependent aldehyde dehydrogenase
VAIKSVNPARPSDVVLEFEPAGPEEVDRAVAAARQAWRGWREESALARGRALASVADDLEARAREVTDLVVREVGKPISEARAEVARAVAIFRYYAQVVLAPDGETYPAPDPRAWLLARRYPAGVCALVTPWNFPVAIPCWKLAPALGYGNAALWKPASAATAVAFLLSEVLSRHLPEWVLQLVPGDGATGEALVSHPEVAAVSFTGSLEVGRSVARVAAGRGARVQCELGGQNPSVLLADADLDRAASTVAYAAMGYAGQKCTAASRVIVEAAASDEALERLRTAVEGLEVVSPERESCLVGPLISQDARASALEAVRRGGERVITGGQALPTEGFYMAPTLVEVEDPSGLLAQEKVFAPVAAVLRAASVDEAVRLANDVRYGLVASVFARDLERALAVAGRLEAGLVRVNAPTTGVDFHAPFGGSKASSIGPREQGLAAREFYTETRTILVSP